MTYGVQKKISIVMPTHEMGGNGLTYFDQQFEAILNQTTDDFDLVVSDQSTDDLIEKRCEYYSDRVDIKYHRFDGPRRAANNVNNAMKLKPSDATFQSDLARILAHYGSAHSGSAAVILCALATLASKFE